jgi:hypothetical protein
MKHLFTFLFITIISTATHAKPLKKSSQTVNSTRIVLNQESQKKLTLRDLTKLTGNEANNLKLWNLLDANKDNSISRSEAICVIDIIEQWDELDSNKDNKLDFFDFSRLSNQKT